MPWDLCLENGVATLRCIPVLFHNLINAALAFAGIFAIFLIVYSGIRFVTSGGDPKKVQGARQIMTYAIIGLVVVLSSFAIIYFVGYLTKSENCVTDIDQIAKGGCK